MTSIDAVTTGDAPAMPAHEQPLLKITDLSVEFAAQHGWVRVVDGVSLSVNPGEVVGLVGESGSGKTVTGLSVMRLVPQPPGRFAGGSIVFGGLDLLALSAKHMRRIQGNSDRNGVPGADAQPEPGVLDRRSDRRARPAPPRPVAERPPPNAPPSCSISSAFPRRRRACRRTRTSSRAGCVSASMIAMALACGPRLLIADEPTTALDVTVQAQVLDLLLDLRREFNMAILLVTHDLGVVAETCDRVAVMYAGQIVETASATSVFDEPAHPYTEGLMMSLPQASRGSGALLTIPGRVPEPSKLPTGCRFHPRCPYAEDVCKVEPEPELVQLSAGRTSRCLRIHEIELEGTE